jgi:hypothetical protein
MLLLGFAAIVRDIQASHDADRALDNALVRATPAKKSDTCAAEENRSVSESLRRGPSRHYHHLAVAAEIADSI